MPLEDKVFMNPATDVSATSLIPVRIETVYPNTDWPAVWKLVRIKCLGIELISVQLKMLHRLLPIRDIGATLVLDGGGGLTHCFFDCSRLAWPCLAVFSRSFLSCWQTQTCNLISD